MFPPFETSYYSDVHCIKYSTTFNIYGFNAKIYTNQYMNINNTITVSIVNDS